LTHRRPAESGPAARIVGPPHSRSHALTPSLKKRQPIAQAGVSWLVRTNSFSPSLLIQDVPKPDDQFDPVLRHRFDRQLEQVGEVCRCRTSRDGPTVTLQRPLDERTQRR
jgi:hypothetical protein